MGKFRRRVASMDFIQILYLCLKLNMTLLFFDDNEMGYVQAIKNVYLQFLWVKRLVNIFL